MPCSIISRLIIRSRRSKRLLKTLVRKIEISAVQQNNRISHKIDYKRASQPFYGLCKFLVLVEFQKHATCGMFSRPRRFCFYARSNNPCQQKGRKKVLLEAGLAAQLCCLYPEKEVLSVIFSVDKHTNKIKSRLDTFLIGINSREAFQFNK